MKPWGVYAAKTRLPPGIDLDHGVLRPTGKQVELKFCTVARWQDGEIVEEKLFYDQVGFMRQIGIL